MCSQRIQVTSGVAGTMCLPCVRSEHAHCPCCQAGASGSGCRVVVESDDQAGASAVDAPVDCQRPATCIRERTGDHARMLSGERRNDAVTVDDTLASKLVEQLGGHLLTIETGEGGAGRQPDPALPPLLQVVAGQHLPYRVVDLLGRVAPAEVLGGVGVQQQVRSGQNDGVETAQPLDLSVGEALLVVDPAAVECPAAGKAAPAPGV